jgi:glycosyltransferase involved in cell wall biosynthesis
VFKGFESEPRKIYSSFSIYIISSFSEGISNSLLEAMATGIPVIASNVIGNKDVIDDGINGLLFDPKNPKTLANCMLNYVENKELVEKLRKNAQMKIIKEYDVNIVAKKVINLSRE